jgi:hypothetical protein
MKACKITRNIHLKITDEDTGVLWKDLIVEAGQTLELPEEAIKKLIALKVAVPGPQTSKPLPIE